MIYADTYSLSLEKPLINNALYVQILLNGTPAKPLKNTFNGDLSIPLLSDVIHVIEHISLLIMMAAHSLQPVLGFNKYT